MTKTLKSIEEAFDRAAPLYDVMNRLYFFGHDQRFRSTLIQELALESNNIILNVCCGTGLDYPTIIPEIGEHGIIVGVDLSTQMLHQAQKKDSKSIASFEPI